MLIMHFKYFWKMKKKEKHHIAGLTYKIESAWECRIKLAERIHSLERAQGNSKPKSVASGLSKNSQNTRKTVSSRSSANSARSKRIEATTRKVKLDVEMKFLDQELELRRLQLMKDVSLANAEEDAMKRI